MVETISPVGYGGRTRRWLAAVALHTLGATATAAGFGALLGAAGGLLGAPWGPAGTALLAAIALAYAARELGGPALPVPAARRQVPDWWRSFFSWPVAAALYGAGLGIGFLTFLTNGGLVVVAAAAILSGRPIAGAVLSGAIGLARGLSALTARPVHTREAGSALVDRLAAHDPSVWRRLNAAALLVVGGVALAVLPRTLSTTPPDAVRAGLATAAAGVVAVAFAWSGIAKAVAAPAWRRTLAGYALPPVVARLAEPLVPALEVLVPVAVIAGVPAAAGGVALALLAAFSLAIVRTRILVGARDVACGCFGGSRVRDYRVLLGRNALLAAAALAAAGAPADPIVRPALPSAAERLPFGLATTAVLVALLTVWRTTTWLGRRGRA